MAISHALNAVVVLAAAVMFVFQCSAMMIGEWKECSNANLVKSTNNLDCWSNGNGQN